MSHLFLQPRLTGKRFETHTLPVELLSDFAALEELIVELAKQKYLEANPQRKRVPRGFTEGISLNLASIEQGSVFPSFVLISSLTANNLFSDSDSTLSYFEEAKTTLIHAVEQAKNEQTIELAPRFISYFNRIGKNLMDDEAIEFNPNSTSQKAILNKQSRRRLLLSADRNAHYSENLTLVVQITELDKAKQSFSIQNHHLKVSGIAIQPEHRDSIFEAFNDFEKGCYVKMKVVAQLNAANNISMINTIEHIDLLDAGDIEVRLEQILALKDGWYYGDGLAFKREELKQFLKLFNANYPNHLPNPNVYPTVDGKVQLEWANETHDLSLSIDTSNMLAEFHALTFSNEHEMEQQLDLNTREDWNILNLWLEQNWF